MLIFRLLGRLWRLLTLFMTPVIWIIKHIWQYTIVVFVFAYTNTAEFARTRLKWLVHGYEPENTRFDRWIDARIGRYLDDASTRIPFMFASLVIGTPLMFVMVLVIGYGIPVVIALTIDQVTYPKHVLQEEFRIDGPNATADLTSAQKGVIVTDALVYQLQAEMDSFWGWTPNDCAGYCPLAWPGLFDNRANRQRGIIYAVRQFSNFWSPATSKLGVGDRESVDLVKARQEGFAIAAETWFLPSAEGSYYNGIEYVREYQKKLLAGDSSAHINVTKNNLAKLMLAIRDDVLAEPYGQLIDRNRTIPWTQLDDAVYRAQGAAIVSRDVLSAVMVAYRQELSVGQIDENLEKAITSLDEATHFNPLWVTRGNGDSMIADSRSKIGRYLSEAIRRLEDVSKALDG